jgi:hypothetical protein
VLLLEEEVEERVKAETEEERSSTAVDFAAANSLSYIFLTVAISPALISGFMPTSV